MQAHIGTELGGIAPPFPYTRPAGGPPGAVGLDLADVLVPAADPRCGAAELGCESVPHLATAATHGSGSNLLVIDVNADRERGLPTLAPGPRRRWDDDEIAFLRARYSDVSQPVRAIAGLLARSPASVRAKARRLCLRRLRPLTSCTPQLPPSPPAVPACAPNSYRLTRLGGREHVWNEDRVHRMIRLWVAGYHHTVISEVLGVGARAASTKASRISLPARTGVDLSHDVEAARRLDVAGREVPKALRDAQGKLRVGKHCNLTGAWFYGPVGIHTCPEAKQTLHYQRLN